MQKNVVYISLSKVVFSCEYGSDIIELFEKNKQIFKRPQESK